MAIQKEGEKEVRKYSIVGSEEADMQDRKISHLSPLGEAMMDRKRVTHSHSRLPTAR